MRAPQVRVEDDNLSSIKMKIPTFKGTRDPDLYLDWERKVEAIFDCHNYFEGKGKVLTDENPLKWDLLFEPDVETIIEVAWISLQDLPPNFIVRETIFSIKSVVGKPLTIDIKTKNQTRSSCARVKIEVALIAKLLQGLSNQMVEIKDMEQVVENKDTKQHQSDEQDELIKYTQEEKDNRRNDEGKDDKKNESALVVYERRDEEVLSLSIQNDNLWQWLE
ncbi:hypothetical protein MTR67_026820 [Solanum verrucosum]|uniref:DUF4283 domain-containing protein n=1 Tax=Solanum verrucosum TaxID=315347 RepID=A0AAF0R6A3_SOLVR|nr:hypothetical protein MTR67_026820 [Solanum verrucosum]